MRYLIVGLGNPGEEYARTRHNIGWLVLDELARKLEAGPWTPVRHGWRTEGKYRSRTYVLLKPDTYMNLSGKAMAYHLQAEKLSTDFLVVITDDLALPFGTLRLKTSGSDGGHNGLKSIQETLGHNRYPRLRVGIGADFAKGRQVDYVLSNFLPTEQAELDKVLQPAAACILDFGFRGPGPAMTAYNKHYLPTPALPGNPTEAAQ